MLPVQSVISPVTTNINLFLRALCLSISSLGFMEGAEYREAHSARERSSAESATCGGAAVSSLPRKEEAMTATLTQNNLLDYLREV